MSTFGELSELATMLAEKACNELYQADEGPLYEEEVKLLSRMFELELNLRHGNITYQHFSDEIFQVRRRYEHYELISNKERRRKHA